jgi:hypothetical protein
MLIWNAETSGVRAVLFKTRRIVTFAVLLLAAGTDTAGAQSTTSCRVEAPADVDASHARWLGACPNGAAEGLGVLRSGEQEPYAFFAGRMQSGRPVDGLLMLCAGGWMAAVRFDAGLHVVSSDGLDPKEDDRVFAQARAAALETAEIFRRAGNSASADYYSRLAQRIVEGRPE